MCLDHFRIKYDDELFKRAKRVRDNLSHGNTYDQAELVLMEHYMREISRYLIQRDIEFKGVFLDGNPKPATDLPVIEPMFEQRAKQKIASFGPI